MTAEFTTDIYFARGSVVSRYNGDISKSVGTVERLFIEDGIKIIGEKVALFDSADGSFIRNAGRGKERGFLFRYLFITILFYLTIILLFSILFHNVITEIIF